MYSLAYYFGMYSSLSLMIQTVSHFWFANSGMLTNNFCNFSPENLLPTLNPLQNIFFQGQSQYFQFMKTVIPVCL